MDLRHLETFIRILETGSFTKAAGLLFLTQPTVSKQLADLERHLGITLLDRNKRNVTPTKAGEIVFAYARDLLATKAEMVQTIDAFKGLKTGSISIGASSIPGIYILPAIVGTYKKAYPGVRVRLAVSDSRNTLRQMESGEIDIGFVGARSESTFLNFRKLVDDTIVAIGSMNTPDRIRLEDLGAYPYLIRETGSGTRKTWEKALTVSKKVDLASLNIAAELTDTEAIKQAVKEGMGISFVSRRAIANDLHFGTMKIVDIAGLPEIKRTFFLVLKKQRMLMPQVRAFIENVDSWRRHEKN